MKPMPKKKSEVICSRCEAKFSSRRDLQNHLNRKYPCNEGIPCSRCHKNFSSADSLRFHVKQCNGPTLSDNEKLQNAENRIIFIENQLKDEIVKKQNNELPEGISNADEFTGECDVDDPHWVFPKNAKPPMTLGDVDPDSPQIYFIKSGTLLKPINTTLGFPIKIGGTDYPYNRTMSQHGHDFGPGTEVLDSVVTNNPVAVERKLKKWLKMKNKFVAAKTPKKKTIETEVITVSDYEEYAMIVRKAQEYAKAHDQEQKVTLDMQQTIQELKEHIQQLSQQLQQK